MRNFFRRLFRRDLVSYHGVEVLCDGRRWIIAENFSLELTCCRSAGWRLWDMGAPVGDQLIGGEYDGNKFRIYVNGHVVCSNY